MDFTDKSPIELTNMHMMMHSQVSFSKDSRFILASGSGDHSLVFDADQMASAFSAGCQLGCLILLPIRACLTLLTCPVLPTCGIRLSCTSWSQSTIRPAIFRPHSRPIPLKWPLALTMLAKGLLSSGTSSLGLQ